MPEPAESHGDVDKVGWVLVRDGRLLVARNHERSLFYLPGGRPEPGETTAQTLAREVREELSVEIDVSTMQHLGSVTAPRDGASGVVRMASYTAEHHGTVAAAGEIAELAWITGADAERVTAAEQQVLAQLVARGHVRAGEAQVR